MKYLTILFFTISTIISACNSENSNDNDRDNDTIINTSEMASIVSVKTSGTENNYNFSVGISSPDTGCKQYADWWEVITEDGTLLYRRILSHSHVNEQPFVRSGGPIAISASQIVIVRAHMNTSGYGTKTFIGSVNTGFTATTHDSKFAKNLASQSPLPNGCAF